MTHGDASRNLVAALSYFLGFITGIIILFVEKDDKFIRFHAMQSTVIFTSLFVINFAVNLLFGFASGFVSGMISVISLIIWLVSMIRAYQGELFKWPIAGDFSEKQVR